MGGFFELTNTVGANVGIHSLRASELQCGNVTMEAISSRTGHDTW
jgi:hypothetical protein